MAWGVVVADFDQNDGVEKPTAARVRPQPGNTFDVGIKTSLDLDALRESVDEFSQILLRSMRAFTTPGAEELVSTVLGVVNDALRTVHPRVRLSQDNSYVGMILSFVRLGTPRSVDVNGVMVDAIDLQFTDYTLLTSLRDALARMGTDRP